MSQPNKIPWEIIKAEYMANATMSLKAVAQKHKVSYSYIQQISAKEKWGNQKKEIMRKATEGALEEVEISLKNLIVRHAKIAKWLQNAGLSRLQKRVNSLIEKEKLIEVGTDKSLKLARMIKGIDDRLLLGMVAEGLKAERELYPKQLQIQGDVNVEATGISKALDYALYEVFRRKLGRKRPSIHDGRKTKSKVRSKNSTKK